MSAIVIDIGGTHIRCAVADETAALHHVRKKTVASFVHGVSSDSVWRELVETITGYEQDCRHRVSQEAPIIISFPGPVSHPSRIVNAPTLVGNDRNMPDLHYEITRRTGRAAYIINDISAAAWQVSRTVDADRFMVVTVSSGIGSKLFDRLHPLRVFDREPYAGEIGHVKIDASDDAMPCDCGGKGHLGAISSGRGVEQFARLQANHEKCRFERSLCVTRYHGSADTLTNENHIVPAALLHDEWALDVVRHCTAPLARVLLTVTAALGLDRIVVIGGFALSLGQVYLDILQNEMTSNCDYELLSNRLPGLLTLANAHEETCLQGAAAYALHIMPR